MIINLNSLALPEKIKVPQEFKLILTFPDFMIHVSNESFLGPL